MLSPDAKDYLDNLAQGLGMRMGAVEREASELRRNSLSADAARKLFRTEVLRINTGTRIAVAVIAALALIGNGLTMVVGNHYVAKAETMCANVTDRKIDHAELRNVERDKAIAREGAREFFELQGLLVKGTSK